MERRYLTLKYRPEIDGLRALAIIPVILFHADFTAFSGGFVGVDIFFVISGFLITSIIIDDLKGAFADNRRADLFAGRTLIGPHRDDLTAIYSAKETPAKLCSTGEQKALLVSLILANGRALSQDFGSAPILLLDEVSAHLDTERQNALYEEILSLGAQAWMTGTGKELFNYYGKRAEFLEVSETSNVSVLK